MRSAFETFSSASSLNSAWNARKGRLISSCFGVDRVTGRQFQKTIKQHLNQLCLELRGEYQPHGLLAFPKPKDDGSFRIICVPTVRDRIVQEALLQQLRPRFKAAKIDNPISYGLAPEKARSIIGARDFACKARVAAPWVYKTDIHKFFDNVDRAILRTALSRVVKQKSLRPVLESILQSEVTDGIESGWKSAVASAGIQHGLGVRQGMPLSPFFSGAYLLPLDLWLAKQSYPSARYVDDIVVFFETEAEAHRFHTKLKFQMAALGLHIGEIDDPASKTSLYGPSDPADFLGMQICLTDQGYRLFVSEKTMEKIEQKILNLASISELLGKKQHLTTFGSYLDSIYRGYANAYDGAHNENELKARIAKFLGETKNLVLYDLFGDRLDTLTSNQKKFAEIE